MKMLIAAVALGSIAIPASAETVNFSVKYDDLDLATAAGQKTLDERIQIAARKACDAATPATGSRIRSSESRQCVRDLTRNAQRQFAAMGDGTQKGG